ncbi:MAG: tetratricopeptide repeat protein [Deltaproteobacteria bacterium]|nr:tetratricopeptide repeat protein [Deltaproteobacteria bacterium]
MYSLYVALAAALSSIVLPSLFGVSALWTFLPGLAVGVGVFIWIRNRFKGQVEAVMAEAMKEIEAMQAIAQRGQQGPHVRAALEAKIQRAAHLMKGALPLAKWQVGLDLQINSQVGLLLFQYYAFLPKEERDARLGEVVAHLEATRVKGPQARLFQGLWYAWACLAAAHVHLGKHSAALEALDGAVAAAPAEGMLWSLYAWVCVHAKQHDKALEALARGAAASPDPHVKANLLALQNKKPLKMADYGQMWWGLALEPSPQMAAMLQQQRMMGRVQMRGRR